MQITSAHRLQKYNATQNSKVCRDEGRRGGESGGGGGGGGRRGGEEWEKIRGEERRVDCYTGAIQRRYHVMPVTSEVLKNVHTTTTAMQNLVPTFQGARFHCSVLHQKKWNLGSSGTWE